VTLLGIVFISVLAADRGWVSAELRVVIGALVSAALYGAGVLAYRRYGRTWAALAAAGAGIGGAYATLAAAAAVYDFLGKPEALLAAAFVAAVGVATALAWEAQTTAVLGLVGAMLGPVLVEGGFTVLGTGLATVVLAATVAVTVWKRWLETMVAGALAGFALAAGLLVEQDPGQDAGAAAVAAAFSVLFLAAGIGHDVRPARPRFGARLVPAVAGILLFAGIAIALDVAFRIDAGSPAGVAAAVAAVWLVTLAAAFSYQVVLGGARVERIPATLLLAGVALVFSTTTRFFEGSEEGLALLVTALPYLALLPLLRGRGQRDLASAVWAVALTVVAVGLGDLLSGSQLALVWAAEGALLSWLALRTGEARLLAGALAYLGLALGQTLVFEAPPQELFVANDDPAEGVPALVYVTLGTLVFAFSYLRAAPGRPRLLGREVPIPSPRSGFLSAVGVASVLTLYAASLAILGLSVWLANDGYQAAFDRGHAAVSSLWALVALSLVVAGLRRRSPALHIAGLALFLATLAKLAYDAAALSPVNRSYSFLAVGALALAAGVCEGLLGPREARMRLAGLVVDPLALAFVALSVPLVAGATGELLDGRTWVVDRQGGGLLVAAAVYLGLAAFVFRKGERDLATVLWLPGVVFAAVAAAELLDGTWLVLAWSIGAGILAALAFRAGEPRLSVAALGYVGLGLGHALAFDAPPREFFVAGDDRASGVPALLCVAAASVVVGFLYRPPAKEEGGAADFFPYPPRRPSSLAAYGLAGALALYAASFAILGLAVAVMADGQTSVEAAFERGHAAVSALWGLVGLVLVSLGLRRRSTPLHVGGLALFALAMVEILAYDLSELSATNAAFAALALGAPALAAGFDEGRLSSTVIRGIRLDPVALALVATSLALVVPAIAVLLDGRTWELDREGAGLLAAAATYGALAALVFRERRDFGTVLWAAALALGTGAAAELLGDPWLVLAWSAAGAVLALLARPAAEPRFVLAAGALVALALGYALVLEVPPTDLFVIEASPAAGLASLVFAILAAYVFAAHLDAGRRRTVAFWVAGALSVFAASVAILGFFQWLAADDAKSVDDAFQRGHTAVSSFWAVVGLALLSIGLKKDWRDFRIGGLALFAIAVAKIFLYDLSNLSAMARALSFLGVGFVLLLAAFLYQRVSAPDEGAGGPPKAEAP